MEVNILDRHRLVAQARLEEIVDVRHLSIEEVIALERERDPVREPVPGIAALACTAESSAPRIQPARVEPVRADPVGHRFERLSRVGGFSSIATPGSPPPVSSLAVPVRDPVRFAIGDALRGV